MPRIAVQFHTSEYEFSHARSPRGRGTWAFGVNEPQPEIDAVLWTPSMTYAEARRWARAWVQEHQEDERVKYDSGLLGTVHLFTQP